MNLNKISILAIKRQLRKRLFLFLAMSLSLSTVLSLFVFVTNQKLDIERQFDEYGANIVIMPKTDSLSLSYGGVSLSGIVTSLDKLSYSDAQEIYNIPNKQNIRAVSPKLIGLSRINNIDVLLVGVDMEEEKKIKGWWEIEGEFPVDDYQVILGVEASETLSLDVGDKFTIGNKELSVAAVLKETGSQDDGVILIPINSAEAILNREHEVSIIEVSALCSDCPIEELVSQISTSLPNADVKAVQQVMNQRMSVVGKFESFAIIIGAVIAVMCGLLTFTVTAGSVTERKKEIGIFRAIGYSGKDILRIIMTETLYLSVTAGIIGVSLSAIISYTLLPSLLQMDQESIVFSLKMGSIGFASLLILSFIASFGPALNASRIDPVETINSY